MVLFSTIMNFELPGIELLGQILNYIVYLLPLILAIVVPLTLYRVLSKKRNYSGKMIEIKEAPLEINNLMKDSVKRNVIRALKKERKYMTAISREINESAPRLRYHLKQLEKANLLKSFKLARESYFSLTDKGQWCLTAINYYYPITNLQLIASRLKKVMGAFKIRRLDFREKKKITENKIHF